MQVQTLRMALALACLGLTAGSARAELIVFSQIHHAWGHIQASSFDALDSVPVSGSCDELVGSDPVHMESSTLGSDTASMHISAEVRSHEDYGYGEEVNAEVSYFFHSSAPAEQFVVDFSGDCGDFPWETWMYYSLWDWRSGSLLDSKFWARDVFEGWVGDVLPYQGIYALSSFGSYRITIGVHARLGDGRQGFGFLDALFTPEPGPVLLLAAAAAGLARRIRRPNV